MVVSQAGFASVRLEACPHRTALLCTQCDMSYYLGGNIGLKSVVHDFKECYACQIVSCGLGIKHLIPILEKENYIVIL